MNILIANTQEFNPKIGGVERISTDLAVEFMKYGHHVYFLACLRSKYSGPYTPSCEQFILPCEEYLDKKNIHAFYGVIAEKNIDVVLNQAGNILDFTKLCALACNKKIPLISESHISPHYPLANLKDYNTDALKKIDIKSLIRTSLYPYRVRTAKRLLKNEYTQIYHMSNRLVLLSEHFFQEINECVENINIKKVVAMPNFTTNTPLETITDTKKNKSVLFAGRLELGQKRPDKMIRIWQKIHKDFPNWKLKIAGDGPHKSKLIEYVEKNSIKNVEFLGFCDVNEQYKKASVLCMTSTYERLPMVLIECAAHGCIPMAFDSFKSIYDIIDNEVNGIVVPSFSMSQYITELKKLMNDEQLRINMSQKAQLINQKFNKDFIVNKWINLFEEVIHENNIL